MLNKLLLVSIFLFFSQSVLGQFIWLEKIKKLTLFVSNREDATKILGEPDDKNDLYSQIFNITGGRVWVRYSTGKCLRKTYDGVETMNGWMVTEGKVVDISISLEKPISPKKLKVDLKKLLNYKESDTPTIVYEDKLTGIDYYTFNGKITDVTFGASEKQYEEFWCK